MYKEKLISIIKKVDSMFDTDELAYLAMTSKIENPLRDKIAFALHNELKDKNLICREWKYPERNNKRTDLAIIDINSQKPVCLIEFKAHSLQRFEKEFAKSFVTDLAKMDEVANIGSEMYFIFFQHLPYSRVTEKHKQAVKYVDSLNWYFDNEKTENEIDKVRNVIHRDWEDKFIKANNKDINLLEKFTINAGKYYDVQLDIEVFFYGPVVKTVNEYKKTYTHI